MSPKYVIALAILVVLAIAGVVVAQRDQVMVNGQCRRTGHIWLMAVRDSRFTPEHVNASLCDRLVIMNDDDIDREIAFGPHDRHATYDGVTERVLTKDGSFAVTLNQTGTFEVHDHFHGQVLGTFTVH